jgi:RHS repeat-associated protein
VKRHDYLPFGEELSALSGLRTPALGYSGGDGVRQQFTSKERDLETALDYFGARYFSSSQGRFTGVDPLLFSAKPINPQTWNRYAYVLNNPLHLIDPSGLLPQDASRPSTKKEAMFFLKHPQIANEIGSVERGSTNISTIAARFATSLGLADNPTGIGSEVNAFRHTLWQAMITVRYGSEIATEVGNAHEDQIPQRVGLATFIGPDADERADSRADLLNNETGRDLAAASPNASNIALANQVLEAFHNTGLVTTQTQPDGSVRTVVTRITDAQYQNAQGLLAPLNNNGFTSAQQSQHDAERRLLRMERHD